MTPPPEPIYLSDASIASKLERARRELLDLSARNRLLNIPRSKTSRTIDIVDEKSTEVYRLLVREGKAFTFLAGRAKQGSEPAEDDEEISALEQPEDETRDDRGVLNRHSDTKLQTRLTSAGLQKRLLDLYQDSKVLEDEQGVNVLFLALGTLRWVDPANKQLVRSAPLVLIPVTLERASARERFRLKSRTEECSSNLSLEAFLDRLHRIKLPAFPAATDELDYGAYVRAVSETIAVKEGWRVEPDDIILGFFSYAKFLMYRDLDPANWPDKMKISDAPLVRALLADGFKPHADRIPPEANVDAFLTPPDMRHIYDSDSSQVVAAFEAKKGLDLVIQGPPGTGKSQTIANIIGEAVAAGKTVLFVAEKMAALDVVKRRLDQAGVGAACLELHSNKANKRLVLEDMRRTLQLGAPKGGSADQFDDALTRKRDLLNTHVTRMHTPLAPGGVAAYETIGRLAAIQRGFGIRAGVSIEGARDWTAEGWRTRLKLIEDMVSWMLSEGLPADHPWWCVALEFVLPVQAERVASKASELASELNGIVGELRGLANALQMEAPERARDMVALSTRARRVGLAPDGPGECLAAAQWQDDSGIQALLECGRERARLGGALREAVKTGKWDARTDGARSVLSNVRPDVTHEWFERAERLVYLGPQLAQAATALCTSLGMDADTASLPALRAMLETARHVVEAPTATPAVFTAAVWDYGLEQASDLVEAVATLESARRELQDQVSDSAWDEDCAALKRTLAAHGGSPLRWFSGEWRRANRLARSLMVSAKAPRDQVLAALDTVSLGRKARDVVRAGDSLGSAAFGPHWRGERSTPGPLRAITQWTRSLGPRSAAVRAITARVGSADEARVHVACVQSILEEFEPLVAEVCGGLKLNPEQTAIVELERRAAMALAAHREARAIFARDTGAAGEYVSWLESLAEWQGNTASIEAARELGQACFGPRWRGSDSDWNELASIAEWISANEDIRLAAASIARPAEVADRAGDVELRLAAAMRSADALFTEVRFDLQRRFGCLCAGEIRLEQLEALLQQWAASRERLSAWVAYAGSAIQARQLGLGKLVEQIEAGEIAHHAAVVELERAYCWELLLAIVESDHELARFHGDAHQTHIAEFERLESGHQHAARVEAVRVHHRGIPRGGAGPAAVLMAEISRRRGHMPIRQLLSHAGPAVQALKPVFMMSPLSIAQFLTPGEMAFDLLVMDEASQIEPVDALGAIARCRQAVIVGDERQLPPTRFFTRLTGGDPDEEDIEAAQVADVESILALFLARGAAERTLTWHYRSRHDSLIALSNAEFYESRLCVMPSAYQREAGRGVLFTAVPSGVYDSGNTRTNVREARRVAQAVMEHARVNPRSSLGVATFSVAQRRAILDELEQMRRGDPASDAFFTAHPGEPFFVKNLENIQGDERDVIFISVGYGRNAEGQMAMRFGPLSSQGGERRLNVLITRAKVRCEVFASIDDRDIDISRAPGKGVAAFQKFLRFARTGELDSRRLGASEPRRRALEEEIASALRGRGFEVDTQVGDGQAMVDVAVIDPNDHGRYTVGIECDGETYAGARSARDRDRLRGSVLRDQGWRLCRVWAMDWYQRPAEQLDRIVSLIARVSEERSLDGQAESAEYPDAVEREEIMETDRGGVPYVEAWVTPPVQGVDLLDTPVQSVAVLVAKIVEAEGPVHHDEVIVRVRSAWGLQRSGARIQEHIAKGITVARRMYGLSSTGKFLSLPGQTVRLRDRSAVTSPGLRYPEMLPPTEIRAGVTEVIRENHAASEAEIVTIVLRRLGYGTSGAKLRGVVETAIEAMRKSGEVVREGEWLVLAKHTLV